MKKGCYTALVTPFTPAGELDQGIITGSIIGVLLIFALTSDISLATGLALFLFTMTTSSFLAMNFTGTTPFTSPSGVEKEMKRYIPAQLICLVISSGLWIYGAF